MAPLARSSSNPSHRVGAKLKSDAAWVEACRERHSAPEMTEEQLLFLSFLSSLNSNSSTSHQLGPRAYHVAASPRIEIAGAHGQALQADFNELESKVETPKEDSSQKRACNARHASSSKGAGVIDHEHDYAIDLLSLSLAPTKPPQPERKRRKFAAPQSQSLPGFSANPAPTLAAAAPVSVRQALGGGSAALSGLGTSVLLSTCKFVSKRTCVECPNVPQIATHKRGYLACACSQGHQWVWCAKCCACPRPAGSKTRGCNNAAHWFERDAFDTGRRNHMNRHQEK
jgi:hypothetical protein